MKNALNQAPKGGAVSKLNGEFYEGGQFMPELGLPKTVKRKAVKVASSTSGRNIARIRISFSYGEFWSVNIRMAGEQKERCVFCGAKPQCEALAASILNEKTRWANVNGLMPHPTELVIE